MKQTTKKTVAFYLSLFVIDMVFFFLYCLLMGWPAEEFSKALGSRPWALAVLGMLGFILAEFVVRVTGIGKEKQ